MFHFLPSLFRYNPLTGKGAIGVEFAGTAVTSPSPFGQGILPDPANKLSQDLINLNPDLQWSEGSFRGFFTLTVCEYNVTAHYFGMRDLCAFLILDAEACDLTEDLLTVSRSIFCFTATPNTDGFNSATFTVLSGELQGRPIRNMSVINETYAYLQVRTSLCARSQEAQLQRVHSGTERTTNRATNNRNFVYTRRLS